jgi:hypothetical protein
VPLAAEPDALVAYAHGRDNSPVDEMVADFCDWTFGFVPLLVETGYVPQSLAALLRRLHDQLLSQPAELATLPCEAVVTLLAWNDARLLARLALEEFRAMGVTVPELGPGLLGGAATVPGTEREAADLRPDLRSTSSESGRTPDRSSSSPSPPGGRGP